MSLTRTLLEVHEAAAEGISSFEEILDVSELAQPSEENGEVSSVFLLEADPASSVPGVFARCTLAVSGTGDWSVLFQTVSYEYELLTKGNLASVKPAERAQEFIEGLGISFGFEPLEVSNPLSFELAAGFAGFLKMLERRVTRGGPLRSMPLLESAASAEPVAVPEEPGMSTEELLEGLEANAKLVALLRGGN